MTTIRSLLSRDLSQPIEEVIKLEQQDEAVVHREITEYVATDRIKGQYFTLLKAIADAPGDPTEGIGVWVSGFFGSGKSSFTKNLGYILSNRTVQGQRASELFVSTLRKQSRPGNEQVDRIEEQIKFINARYASHVMMFDVQLDRANRRATEPIAEIMYTVLLRELDYAEDYDIAELEIELESEGRLAEFVRAVAALAREGGEKGRVAPSVPRTLTGLSPEDYGIWQRIRAGAQRIPRASAALHAIDPSTYSSPDTWLASLRQEADITVRTLVNRTFDLAARRRPGQGVVFIMDEVGSYVARSVEKIENLRGVVELFGTEGRERVLARKAVAPVWVVVISQEKLDEVVNAIGDKRVELARVQDRFRTRVDMEPADIREVATKRVLSKKPAAEPALRAQYDAASALLKTHARLANTARKSEVSREDFVQFYPYLPHFIDLSIDIVTGIRLQPGASRHISGSNRTIIKQAYEMLVSERTALADAPVGELVTLDRIYDLIEGSLPTERRKDIGDIIDRWPDDPWPARTAKAIALLEYVRDLPRTEANLAALLYRRLGDDSPLSGVERAIGLLSEAQFVRHTDSGWKLQTAQEKTWTAERNAFNPTPRERNELLEDAFRTIFSEAAVTRYHYRNLRNFRVGVTWDGRAITSGDSQVPLAVRTADGPDAFFEASERVRQESRVKTLELFWVMALTDDLLEITAELYRSKSMVGKYVQLSSQGKLTQYDPGSLDAEKLEVLRLAARQKDLLTSALITGQGFFCGVGKDGSVLGKTLPEILKTFFDYAVPALYPKLEMGARPIKGNEAEEILKAANLNGLTKIFYAPPDGLDLVKHEGAKYVVNSAAAIVKEVADYLSQEHSYGNKVTGRSLEGHFGGIGYGWEAEMLWLVTATLLRGGAMEVTYQGRRFRNHLDPQARAPFSGANAFRSASFAPRKAPNLQTLVSAARRFEDLTGEEVDVEESAIAQAFQKFARQELEKLLPVEATVRANAIPVVPLLHEYHLTLETVLNSASDDCVNMLAGEGESFAELRKSASAIAKATDDKGLVRLGRLRTAVQQIWPQLAAEAQDGDLTQAADEIKAALSDASYLEKPKEMDEAARRLLTAYNDLYAARHTARVAAFAQAIDDVRGQASWLSVPESMQAPILKPLTDRAGHDLAMGKDDLACTVCGANLASMSSDLSAVVRIRSDVLLRVQQLTEPEQKVERLRFSDVAGVGRTLSTEAEVKRLLEELSLELLTRIAAGVKVVLE